jgi:hypothetical protein
MWSALEDALAFLLRHAPQNAEDFSLPRTLKLIETMEDFLFGFITDTASVVENQLGLLMLGNLRVTLFEQRPHDFFGVVRIHLTTEGLNVKRFHNRANSVQRN